MEKQYCKVGTVTTIGADEDTISRLEYQYQNFLEKASNMQCSNTQLSEFFELKAKKIQKLLAQLV